ncbi:trafficking protein particle complex subunit 6A isoform X1 [Antechinus flavipes]|uniref:trafficking protein particle complex subunit 6A isoform X1 n=1 Tax=Antechinus flavipes TaxID=38775 RepID=UPI002235EDB6|nr:trafficking protein particle complex subunit 6A isoform X1 [Antechinus flavipes]
MGKIGGREELGCHSRGRIQRWGWRSGSLGGERALSPSHPRGALKTGKEDALTAGSREESRRPPERQVPGGRSSEPALSSLADVRDWEGAEGRLDGPGGHGLPRGPGPGREAAPRGPGLPRGAGHHQVPLQGPVGSRVREADGQPQDQPPGHLHPAGQQLLLPDPDGLGPAVSGGSPQGKFQVVIQKA